MKISKKKRDSRFLIIIKLTAALIILELCRLQKFLDVIILIIIKEPVKYE